MKYMDEYRDPVLVRKLAEAIKKAVHKPHVIMEVCGGQTHAIVKYGLDQLLPDGVELLHGPGCPVCVTPLECIDKALAIAACKDVIFCSFGDMLRVPGSQRDLFAVKASGGDIRIVYSPLDALVLARNHPDKEVVFFAVGFETTAPGNAMAIAKAYTEGVKNFSVLVSHVLVPPALHVIMQTPQVRITGFLAAGHVCTVMGHTAYDAIAATYRVPIVVTGFEPVDILQGILTCIQKSERQMYTVENAYPRSVRKEGNLPARRMIEEIFEIVPRKWRGIGSIPASGYAIRETYATYNADRRFNLEDFVVEEKSVCISGAILQGHKKPLECPAFGKECVPEFPLGATMVSSEGACAAYYRYRSHEHMGAD